jgi:6-pyruvoyltetrahydropterin/6-carboxytetrahydropterin synthase
MFTVERAFTFSAGHSLTSGEGMCARPHGHTFTLTIILSAPRLQTEGPEKNMIVDLDRMQALIKPMIDQYFEHRWLNDTLETDAPTLEYAAYWIFNHLSPTLDHLYCIRLTEDGISTATYCPAGRLREDARLPKDKGLRMKDKGAPRSPRPGGGPYP